MSELVFCLVSLISFDTVKLTFDRPEGTKSHIGRASSAASLHQRHDCAHTVRKHGTYDLN